MGISGIVDTLLDKIGLIGEQNVAITWGIALKQWQYSSWLLISARLRC
jgi:hypothetical protein